MSSLHAAPPHGFALPRLCSFAVRSGTLALLLAIGLLGTAQAQTVMLSNLAGTSYAGYANTRNESDGTLNTANAGSFTTGSEATVLNSLSLLGVSGSGTDFSVELYSDSGNLPGTLLETLSGPTSPTSASTTYVYTSGGSLTLSANTTYWWVTTVPTGTTAANFNSNYVTNSADVAADGWSIGRYAYQTNGGAWSNGTGRSMQFSVSTSAIPEPSTYAALFGAAALGLAAYRRRLARS